MTVVRTIATHDLVSQLYPRPITERDELGIAVGKAIDTALSRYSHEASRGGRPTATATRRHAEEVLEEELADAHVALRPEERGQVLAQIAGVLQAFRQSEVFGLSRPRSRLILINGVVGLYAQPDFWDGRTRFYEMKSYHATLDRPEIALQLDVFQLAFPGVTGVLLSFDRHVSPVKTEMVLAPPVGPDRAREVLGKALALGQAQGTEKVLEFVDAPLVPYTVAP